MPGHVFIIRGDLRLFACDAWLIPTGRLAQPNDNWFLPDYRGPRQGTPFQEDGPRVQLFPEWPAEQPRAWIARVAGPQKSIPWYIQGALEFLHTAAATIAQSGQPPLFRRVKPLLALPLVGIGFGGAAQRAGEIVQALLPELENFVAHHETDVALVCKEASGYAAAQAERVRRGNWPTDLSPALRTEAELLAQRALRGELALFLGAGVSMAAGLPGWQDLVGALGLQAGMSAEERAALTDLRNVLDQATIIERRLRERQVELGEAIKEEFTSRRYYALNHAQLAALPVREVITTNYDQLFESVWAEHDAAGISVLPGMVRPNGRRWLLKMHGCLSNPKRIVLTRTSYTRYDEQLPALAGIVQAFLITRHMLFVGFSLTDDNFHRIADAVRRMRSATAELNRFGTTLTLGHGGLTEVLWDQDFHRIRMDERREAADFPYPEAARRLEIFLDYLLSRTRNTTHLLEGERFDPVLTPGERKLRDALQRFIKDLSAEDARTEIRGTVAWPLIERLLVNLGFDPR